VGVAIYKCTCNLTSKQLIENPCIHCLTCRASLSS